MKQDIAAESIAEEMLYLTGKALLEDDDDMFLSCMELPQLMETAQGRRLITTQQEVRTILADLRQFIKDQDIVDLVRTVVSAEFIDADTIGSTHVSLMVQSEGPPKTAPYPVYSIIRRFGTSWRMVSSLYAIMDSPEHNDVLLSKNSTHDTNLDG